MAFGVLWSELATNAGSESRACSVSEAGDVVVVDSGSGLGEVAIACNTCSRSKSPNCC